MSESKDELHSLVNTIPPQTNEAFGFPREKQRLLWYTDKIPKQKWWSVYYVDDAEKIIYSECWIEPRMGTVLYPLKSQRRGFTFDKKTKKIKTWYGTSVNMMNHLPKFLTAMKLEWVINEKLQDWLTKTLLEKILSGAITNPKEACKHIVKTLRLKGLSPESLRQYIKSAQGGKKTLLSVKEAILDLEVFAKSGDYTGYTKADIVKQAKALGRKFCWSWSENRLHDLHQEWTRELMKAELDLLEDEQIDWSELVVPEGFEVISSRRRLFEEGTIMSHCVYTNYWERVRSKSYLVLRVQDPDGNTATVGITTYDKKVDQIKSLRNSEPSQQIRLMVSELMKTKTFLDSITPVEEELESLPF